jgi:flagellar biosynthesis protein FliQ
MASSTPRNATMPSDAAQQMLSELLWTALWISAPLLAATLVVGVLVSIFQVVTQIQEMSLTYIPKIIVAVLVLVAAGPWMLKRLLAYSIGIIVNIPTNF